MEAEYMALTEATKELKWVRQLLTELGYGDSMNKPTDPYFDNQSAIALTKILFHMQGQNTSTFVITLSVKQFTIKLFGFNTFLHRK
jgi:hypothetical protein